MDREKAVVTITGRDEVGILASVSACCANANASVIEMTQSVKQDFFTMMMLTDTSRANTDFDGIADALSRKGEEMQLSIRVQREDIFNAMHRI